MAKGKIQILNELVAEKNAQADLSTLTSASSTAIWRLWLNIFLDALVLLYQDWDIAKSELAVIGAQQNIGTNRWYEGLALGYSGGTVVQRASCIDNGSKVILKVAQSSAGVTTHLSDANLQALTTFMLSKKVMGTDLSILSQTADLFWLGLSVKYTGVMATVKAAVVAQIKAYLANHEYGTPISMSLLENDVFNVPGVLDVQLTSVKRDAGSGYVLELSNELVANAGYFEVGKDISSNDLLDIIMYT